MSENIVDVPWRIPDSWSWSAIGDVTEVVGGGTPSTTDPKFWEGGTVPWVTPADLSGYTAMRIAHGSRFITPHGLQGSGAKLLPAGTVLMSSRAPVGYAAIAAQPLSTNQGFKSFSPTPALLPEYLYYFIVGNRRLLLDRSGGTTFQEISGRAAATIPVPIAPVGEQRRIVAAIEEYLSHLDAAVAGLERLKILANRYAAAVLASACDMRLVSIGNAAAWKTLEECALPDRGSITDGPFGSNLKSEHYTASGARVIRLQNIGGGTFIDQSAFISLDHFERLRKHEAREGDLIIAALGARLPRACIVPPGLGPTVVKADCFRLRPDPRVTRPAWLNIVLNAEPTRHRASQSIKGVGRPRLNLSVIRNLTIPVPPVGDQDRIIAEVERRLSSADNVRNQCSIAIVRATSLRQSILKCAFAGKLVQQSERDEPASVLLDSLCAWRATPSTKPGKSRRSA